jgi:hypothetical protein
VRLKANTSKVPERSRGSVTLQGTFDATELGGTLGELQSKGAAVEVRGAGLAAPEILWFPWTRCGQLSTTRFKCIGTRGEVLTLRQKMGTNLFKLRINAPKRAIGASLSRSPVDVTLSIAGVDRHDQMARCSSPNETVASCK